MLLFLASDEVQKSVLENSYLTGWKGYCRRSLKEYLNHLNIALGSCGEFHSCYESCMQADQISKEEYEELDVLHYKVENQLLKLIESLQRKQKGGQWEDTFQPG
jgi:hypothetical protein